MNLPPGSMEQQQLPGAEPNGNGHQAPGVDIIHNLCKEIYPNQINPLTATTLVKFWLGGPDPLDYISMFDNPGYPEEGIPPHWHYVSLGLTDLHGDCRLHARSQPGMPSGFGFELTFRLAKTNCDTGPPTWPANLMQQIAKYVFSSSNLLMPGDHVSWHVTLNSNSGNGNTNGPSDIVPGRINQILMTRDPQLPNYFSTELGDLSFVQIVGVTSEELQAAQHWNGLGVLNLLKSPMCCGPWLITDMRRNQSIMEMDASVAQKIQSGFEREGSNLSGVSARMWWLPMGAERDTDAYRESREVPEDEEESDIKPDIKLERLSPCEQDANDDEENKMRILPGLNITFNWESGSLLPLAIKGRLMHGRHFTFKSFVTHTAITFVPPSVTGRMATKEKPYVCHGPWLQVYLPEELTERMAHEFEVLTSPGQIELPKRFLWPEYKLAITVIKD